MAFIKSYCLLHQFIKLHDVQLRHGLLQLLSLGLLACEAVAHKAKLKVQVGRHSRPLDFLLGLEVHVNDDFQGVTQEEVIRCLLGQVSVAFFEDDLLGCCGFRRGRGLAFRGTNHWGLVILPCKEGLQVGRVVGDQSGGPLTLVSEIVFEFHIIKVSLDVLGIVNVRAIFLLFVPINRQLVDEKLEPFVPVSRVNVFSVVLLLVDEGFISYVKYGIKDGASELIPPFPLRLLVDNAHLLVPLLERL